MDWIATQSRYFNINLEQDMTHPWTLNAILHVPLTRLPSNLEHNILIRYTIAWKKVRRKAELSITMTQHSPILHNPVFPQGQTHKAYTQCKIKGIDNFYKLYYNSTWKLKTFQELQAEYDIPTCQYLQYLQITSYCKDQKWKPEMCFQKHFIDSLLAHN